MGLLEYTILFTIANNQHTLDSAIAKLKIDGVELNLIQSRPSKNYKWEYEISADVAITHMEILERLENTLNEIGKNVIIVELNDKMPKTPCNTTPWFPRKISDLDGFASKTLECGEDLSADHPGFTDQEYRKRRTEITEIARQFKTGSKIPKIKYTQNEISTWKTVYEKVTKLHTTHACKEMQYVFPLLERNCGYSSENIPQLQDVSDFLQECTGFTLRPVMGLLSSRDFLSGLAFRIFHSTQYIRHHSQPFYTPEPDVCHELLGHVPLFADPDFAAFSQEIGLTSLGASDEEIKRLSTIYWFTVEFGLCMQDGEIKAFGAGLLSSFGELEYCLTDKAQKIPFDPFKAATQPYPITSFQPLYFVAESFRNAQDRIREYSSTLGHPSTLHYNPYTKCIDILDSKEKILTFASGIESEVKLLMDSLAKL